jgi:hypothetical protein
MGARDILHSSGCGGGLWGGGGGGVGEGCGGGVEGGCDGEDLKGLRFWEGLTRTTPPADELFTRSLILILLIHSLTYTYARPHRTDNWEARPRRRQSLNAGNRRCNRR